MLLDNVFEQKNIIAQTVSKELEKASHEFVHVYLFENKCIGWSTPCPILNIWILPWWYRFE